MVDHHIPLTISDIVQMVQDAEQFWASAHARRVIHLAASISAGQSYAKPILEMAAWLHDWGAFPQYAIAGMNHVERSVEVISESILPRLGLSAVQQEMLLEAVALHDYRSTQTPRFFESILLREADMLDLIGATGFAREFAWGPNNLQVVYQRLVRRRASMTGVFTLPEAVRLAEQRFAHMDACLQALQEETNGIL